MAAFELCTLEVVESTSCLISEFCGAERCGAIRRKTSAENLVEVFGVCRG